MTHEMDTRGMIWWCAPWCYKYCEIIYFPRRFNFVYFVGRAIHEFKIPTKYLFILVILHVIWNRQLPSVHEYVQCHQTTTFLAHEIKCFHCITFASYHNRIECPTFYNTEQPQKGYLQNTQPHISWHELIHEVV